MRTKRKENTNVVALWKLERHFNICKARLANYFCNKYKK